MPVTILTWYLVNVQVRNRLPGSSPIVNANVVALWAKLFIGDSLGVI